MMGYPGPGVYQISGGRLEAAWIYLGDSPAPPPGPFPPPPMSGNSGELSITDTAAEIYVSEALVLGEDAIVSAVPGTVIHMTGSALDNQSSTPSNLTGLMNLELVFEGGPDDIDPFEVAGEDRMALPRGMQNNFALGTLTLGGDNVGRVNLVDLVTKPVQPWQAARRSMWRIFA